MSEPKVGDLLRWGKPGPLVLTIERVGGYTPLCDGWWVRAGGLEMVVRHEPEDGIDWVRHTWPTAE